MSGHPSARLRRLTEEHDEAAADSGSFGQRTTPEASTAAGPSTRTTLESNDVDRSGDLVNGTSQSHRQFGQGPSMSFYTSAPSVDTTTGSSVVAGAQRCDACGNVFMPDAHFCRRCGKRRIVRLKSDQWDFTGVIWQWSQLDRRFTCCCRRRKGSDDHFRFLDRDADFHQSVGRWNIHRLATEKTTSREIRRLYLNDVYHSFMDIESVWLQFLVYTVAYMFCFLAFAFVYMAISDRCGLELDGSYLKAYYLSVETMVTIGYGVPDPYYSECYEGAVVITIQSLLQYFLNAMVIGAVFVRLTRPQTRANTILFSDKAVIQQRNGSFFFMFQVCEAKHHDLLEAHVRCYCIRRDRKGRRKYSTMPMRLQHPDDDQGAMILMTLPEQIVHRIDHWSPLSPSWESIQEQRRSKAESRLHEGRSGGTLKGEVFEGAKENPLQPQPEFWCSDNWFSVPQRQADCDQGNRDSCVCPMCGESFQSLELLRRHTEYQAAQDAASGAPAELRHVPWTMEDFQSWGWTIVEERGESSRHVGHNMTRSHTSISSSAVTQGEGGAEVVLAGPAREELQNYLTRQAHIEVLVLVEGIEPTTSSTIQARHSYLFPEDVAWNKEFVDCLLPGTPDRPCAVDLSFFHELAPIEPHEDPARETTLWMPDPKKRPDNGQTSATCSFRSNDSSQTREPEVQI